MKSETIMIIEISNKFSNVFRFTLLLISREFDVFKDNYLNKIFRAKIDVEKLIKHNSILFFQSKKNEIVAKS